MVAGPENHSRPSPQTTYPSIAYGDPRAPPSALCRRVTDRTCASATRPRHSPQGAGMGHSTAVEVVRCGGDLRVWRPNHPTTCGKVERFQQTFKNWLRAQTQPATIGELQQLLDTFVDVYNNNRPHRSLPHRATPATIYTTRPKATPGTRTDPHYRVRHDRVDQGGSISLRVNGRLHHIGIGRTHTGTRVILLINDLDIRIIHAATGEILRNLTVDPTRSYQGTGPPKGPTRPKTKRPEPS